MTNPTPTDGDAFLRLIGRRHEIHPDDIVAFSHPTEESARHYIKGNAEHYGHPSFGPIHTEAGWLEAVDLRPTLAANGIDPTPPDKP